MYVLGVTRLEYFCQNNVSLCANDAGPAAKQARAEKTQYADLAGADASGKPIAVKTVVYDPQHAT